MCAQRWDVLVPCCAVVPIVEKVRGLINYALSQGLSHRPCSSSSLSRVAKDLLNGQRLLVVCIHIFNAAAACCCSNFPLDCELLRFFFDLEIITFAVAARFHAQPVPI